jgi:hypothetical protein
MGLKERDKTDTNTTQESRQAMPNETGSHVAKESPNLTNRSPNLRRRALIAGLATTPVLLSLSSRSALGQSNVECSLLYSVMLGGSVANLPPALLNGQGWDQNNVPEHAIENMYEAHQCNDQSNTAAGNSNGNANGNSSN